MPFPLSRCLVVLTTIVLAGCESGGSWPNLADVPPEVEPGFQNASTLTPPPAPPPPATAGEAQATMSTASGALTGLGARLDQHRARFAQLQQTLQGQSTALDANAAAGASSDDWSKAQADLSRLNADVDMLRDLREDVAADAAAGAALLADLEPVTRAGLDADSRARLAGLQDRLDTVLSGLGALDREIGDARESWLARTSRLAAQFDRAPPPLAGIAAAPEPPEPARPRARKARPKPAAEAEASGPRDSGDRFKGRQPLVTLTFDDPKLDFEARLSGLIDKVRAQYPDIAFDIETTGAAPDQLAKVRGMLKTRDIPSDVFVSPPGPGAPPTIKLYPR